MKIDWEALTSGSVGVLISAAGLSLESAEHWINIICAILGIIVTIIGALILPLLKWLKAAKEDGKITIDEVEDAAKIVQDGVQKVAEDIKEKTDKHEE